MRFIFSLVLLLALLGAGQSPARAEAVLTVVFSGNSWGYLKPCPT